jgi:hypothetical protein
MRDELDSIVDQVRHSKRGASEDEIFEAVHAIAKGTCF